MKTISTNPTWFFSITAGMIRPLTNGREGQDPEDMPKLTHLANTNSVLSEKMKYVNPACCISATRMILLLQQCRLLSLQTWMVQLPLRRLRYETLDTNPY